MLAVSTNKPDLVTQAQSLAAELHLPFAEPDEHYAYLLMLTPNYLGIVKTGAKSLPLYVDFLSGKVTYRREHASLRNEILARALGLTHRNNPTIVDATAGLARDGFILASLGFEIQLLERSPIAHALVADGIARAAKNPYVAPIVNRLHLFQTDAIEWLKSSSEKPDIIYLDPMFPERRKSASVKKEMQIFQDIIGPDEDVEELLKTALTCAQKRVVVKRPRLADPIKGPEPSFVMKGSSSRFDIYLTEDAHGNSTPIA